MQSYPLDLATMLYNLRGQRGQFFATQEHVPGQREPCQALLDLVERKAIACTLRTSRGALLAEGARAFDLLERLGTIDWLWESALAPPLALPGGDLPAAQPSLSLGGWNRFLPKPFWSARASNAGS